MRDCAQFRADRSNRNWDMAVIRFLRWRLPAIFDFQKFEVLATGPVRKANMRHLAKFRKKEIDKDFLKYNFHKIIPTQ